MSSLKPATREKLKAVSTPTLMTALYKRGLRNQWVRMCAASTPKPVRWLDRHLRFRTCRRARI